MDKTVVFLLESKWQKETSKETALAVENYAEFGVKCRVVYRRNESEATRNESAVRDMEALAYDGLVIVDSARLRTEAEERGLHPMGYSHCLNRTESFKGLSYVLEEPQWLDADSLQKLYERAHGLPWEILRTQHCIVREFTLSDLDAIYALYDDDARKFLTPPSDDVEKERAILQAYCERIYGLYGYGQWAVLDKESGELIGRMGYSFVTADAGRNAGKDAEDANGLSQCDASFGYLMRRSHRGRGLTMEVCRALLTYGQESLGFEKIFAEAAKENEVSNAVLTKLGFLPIGESESGDTSYYMLSR